MESGFEQVHAIGLGEKKKKEREKERNKGKKEEHLLLSTGRCNPPRH